MKRIIHILIALVIGFLVAGAGTKITYPCAPPAGGYSGCVSYAKAVTHPSDLIHNKQGSLTHFSEYFVVTALVSFAIISFYSNRKAKV